jgi:hypothetical protein
MACLYKSQTDKFKVSKMSPGRDGDLEPVKEKLEVRKGRLENARREEEERFGRAMGHGRSR